MTSDKVREVGRSKQLTRRLHHARFRRI